MRRDVDMERVVKGMNVVADLIEEGYGGKEIGEAVARLLKNQNRVTKDELRAEVQRARTEL